MAMLSRKKYHLEFCYLQWLKLKNQPQIYNFMQRFVFIQLLTIVILV